MPDEVSAGTVRVEKPINPATAPILTCNVCGNPARCFTLTELVSQVPPFRMFHGMMFNICSSCLTQLIAGIKTDKTTVDDPEEYPLPPRMQSRVEMIVSSRTEPVTKIKAEYNPKLKVDPKTIPGVPK
jgi:hypothetical protein